MTWSRTPIFVDGRVVAMGTHESLLAGVPRYGEVLASEGGEAVVVGEVTS